MNHLSVKKKTMQCQVKTLRSVALLIITFWFGLISAQNLDWSSLESDKMKIESHSSAQGEVISSYFPYISEMGSFIWSWNPSKQVIAQPKKTSDSIYIEPPMSALNELMKTLFVEFDVSSTQHFRKVWFQPKADLRYRGLFGIHDFKKKRPLVILRMGIHGNVDELIAERFLAKLIYEDLDANLLIIESLTSHAFLSKNKNISFGGIDEGLQTFIALKEIEKSHLNKIISSTHLVSVSMGAHGTFVTALLDQLNGRQISSIVNFCPLIDLQSTLESGQEVNLKNAAVSLWNVRRLRAVFDLYPQEKELNKWWVTFFDWKPRFTSALMGILNRDRHQPLISTNEIDNLVPKMKWPKGFKEHLESSQSFYELNNYWKYYMGVTTPIMIYTTPNDPLVVNELNSEKIFKGVQPGDFSSLKYHRLERGVHCGLASVYRWDYLVKLLKEGLGL